MATLTHDTAAAPVRAAAPQASPWPLAGGLTVVGAGLAVLALVGPLGGELVRYRVTETLRNQTIGADAVALLVVAPLALLAAVLVLRRHVGGPLLALAVGPFTSYMMLQYVLGPEYGRLPGDNERLFPLCLVLFAAGWLVALRAWATVDERGLPSSRRRDLLVGRWLLPALAVVAFVRYVPALADAMSSHPGDAGYLAGPAFFWAIALLDLGVFLPATVLACAGLVRGAPWARRCACLVAGWFALIGLAVASMGGAMYANDDPNASAGAAAFLGVLGLLFVMLAVVVYAPLLRGGRAVVRRTASSAGSGGADGGG